MTNPIRLLVTALLLGAAAQVAAQSARVTMDLDGTWEFEQTPTALPPTAFTHQIPVPGLAYLATPPLEQRELYFSAPRASGRAPEPEHAKYIPRYNWYRRSVYVPAELRGREAVLTLLKSQFVTQAFVNGRDVGYGESSTTPLDFTVTSALHYGADNEILIRTGDHAWLPSSVPGGIDNEKSNYAPGIWDDVELSFTGHYHIHRTLVLPSFRNKSCTVKLRIENLSPARTGYGVPLVFPFKVRVDLKEKVSGEGRGSAEKICQMRDGRMEEFEITIPVSDPHPWSPDDPFLYVADITLQDHEATSDHVQVQWGLRDFGRSGKYFTLNGQRIMLRGSNITLHRFFNDPQCGDLPWNRAWVRKLLSEIPKKTHWNVMRNSVGLLPRFWYDIADECGLMFQNEWMYWQAHGDDEETRKEFTDWVWADGSHPSIAIWDALNEYEDNYIGNVLIPELRRLDPTRVWDNGYMTKDDYLVNVQIPQAQKAAPQAVMIMPNSPPFNILGEDDVDETHPYFHQLWRQDFPAWMETSKLEIGDLDYWPDYPQSMDYHAAAQIVNEYAWIWLWRNGMPSLLSPQFYEYYLGGFGDARANRELQAYDLQCETELFRSHQSVAGIMAFAYLTNDYGSTGDWFVGDIKNLEPGPTLRWFRHCFAPTAVFIDLPDQRYNQRVQPCEPGSTLIFNLIGVNDLPEEVAGTVELYVVDSAGTKGPVQSLAVTLPSYIRQKIPVQFHLPEHPDGYVLVARFTSTGEGAKPVASRRYLKVGEATQYQFPDLNPDGL